MIGGRGHPITAIVSQSDVCRKIPICSVNLAEPATRALPLGTPPVPQRTSAINTRMATNWADWSRLAHGGIWPQDLNRAALTVLSPHRASRTNPPGQDQVHPHPLQEAWKMIERHGTRVSLLFTEGEPLLQEMEQQEQMPCEAHPLFRCFRVPNAGHTFRPQWAQQLAHDILDSELSRIGLLACSSLAVRHWDTKAAP